MKLIEKFIWRRFIRISRKRKR